MRNDRMAIGYLEDATVRVGELKRLFEMRRFNVVIILSLSVVGCKTG